MHMRPSRVLRRLRAGQPAISFKINLSDPRAVEIAALAGFDAVWLCNEHVGNDLQTTEAMIWAAKTQDCDAIVRVCRGSYSDYVRPLEMDAAGIMVPHCMSAADAAQVVKWTRFQPLGLRAIDGGNADGRYCAMDFVQYLKEANEQRLVIVQIEDPEALDELDGIAATPGIDMLLFGPGDFTHALGIPGQGGDPRVQKARERVVAACRRHGKFAGTVGPLSALPGLLEMGFNFVNVGADVLAIGEYARNIMNTARPAGSEAAAPAAATPY